MNTDSSFLVDSWQASVGMVARGRLIIETDCMSLSTLLQPNMPNCSCLHHNIVDIKDLMAHFQSRYVCCQEEVQRSGTWIGGAR